MRAAHGWADEVARHVNKMMDEETRAACKPDKSRRFAWWSRRAALCAAAMFCVLGCIPHKVQESPQTPLHLPGSFLQAPHDERDASATTRPGTASPTTVHMPTSRWWESLGEEELDRLIRAALQDNLGMRAAWARIAQADALRVQARSGWFPQMDLSMSGSRQRIRTLFGSFENSLYSATLAPSYEIDLFGKVKAQKKAADLDLMATEDELQVTAMSLAATVTERWLDLLDARRRRHILEAQRDINLSYLDILEARFAQGTNSAVDVHQQRQQVAQVLSTLALVEGDESAALHALAALVGQAPRQELRVLGVALQHDPRPLPTLPSLPSVGIPTDLVQQRPDVRAARRRVVAADYRVGAAIADRLPSLRLSGDFGLTSTDLSQLLSGFVWSIIGSVTGPLVDGGRRRAEVDRTRAVVKEQLMVFGDTLLQALVEVEDALARERATRAHLLQVEQELDVAQETLTAAERRYREGIGDYLPVFTALRAEQSLQLQRQQAQRNVLSWRVSLHRALGGSWMKALPPPNDKALPGQKTEKTEREPS